MDDNDKAIGNMVICDNYINNGFLRAYIIHPGTRNREQIT